ncbi:MAG: NAD/NADP octopine/nopaline dehydrogenase family protein [Spirochaetales bacterium]|nr:NAD/NADP octopine/nopaline dehydrogenase family protein [Spirochaetales bacterium]
MKDLPNITVCGCGSGGMAMAADLALLGCRVNVYEVPEFKENLDPIRQSDGITLTGQTHSGKTGLAKLHTITNEAEEAVENAELIMINVPAPVVNSFMEKLSPHLNQGQTLLVTTGYWAALRSKPILQNHISLDKVTLVEGHIMPYLSRKLGPAHVHIYNYKKDIRISAWPATRNNSAHELIGKIYPQVTPSKHVLENNFYAGNPSIHAQINIPKAEFFFERAREFRFYGEVSMCASKLVDEFDKERRAVASAFECEVPTCADWVSRAYGYPGQNIYEQFGHVTCEHGQRWGNDSGNRRVLQEDLCYFFVPMEQLAAIAGLDIPVTKAMIEMLRIFTDFDYRAHGVTLKDLGMDGLNKRQIIDYLTHGTY